MESILYQLFNGDYDITPKRSKKQQEMCDQIFTELDQVKAALGDPFLDQFLELTARRMDLESFQYYRSGFVLGVRLMLEVFECQPSI